MPLWSRTLSLAGLVFFASIDADTVMPPDQTPSNEITAVWSATESLKHLFDNQAPTENASPTAAILPSENPAVDMPPFPTPPLYEIYEYAPDLGVEEIFTKPGMGLDRIYPASTLKLCFISPERAPCDINDLYLIRVALIEEAGKLRAPLEGECGTLYFLADLASQPIELRASAIIAITKQIVAYLNDMGYAGVFASVDPLQIDQKGNDLRKRRERHITLLIGMAYIQSMDTVAYNKQGSPPQINACNDARLKLGFAIDSNCPDSLLNECAINDQLLLINRYPARRAFAQIEEMDPTGATKLNLVIEKCKTQHFVANISNTGTSTTGHWIERFQYLDYQLTNHDDTLSVDYATANFSTMHAYGLKYECPWWNSNIVRFGIEGGYSTFSIEALALNNNLKGRQWLAGAYVKILAYQYHDLFVDFRTGFNWFNARTINSITNTNVDENFFIPYAGFSVERKRPEQQIEAYVAYKQNIAPIAGTDKNDLYLLGRAKPTLNWKVVEFWGHFSQYISPYIECEDGCRLNLVHEISLSVRGQYAFNDRLIPQEEMVLGGLYTVRGYSQSLVAGDSVYSGQLEYRYHLPQDCSLFSSSACCNNRLWDFMARLFVDAGCANYNRRFSYESNTTLLGTGFGFEFTYKKNLIVRGDAGIAAISVPSQGYDAGNGRVYVSATLLF